MAFPQEYNACLEKYSPDPSVEINVSHFYWYKILPQPKKAVSCAIIATMDSLAINRATISISALLTNDATIRELNKTHRSKDQCTDVLSFAPNSNYVSPDAPLGEIVLSSGASRKGARTLKIPFAYHALRLVVHGTLHIFGYDHESDTDAAHMENKEREVLESMGIPIRNMF